VRWAHGRDCGECPDCGKRRYTSKRSAKSAAERVDRRMRAYRCGAYWHVGHLSKHVIRGRIGRDDLGPQ
jgi:hypothetical protein